MLYVLIRIAYQGDSNEYTKHIIVNIKKKITVKILNIGTCMSEQTV